VVATSGREALEFLLKNEVAVILVDVCMPELDGFELAAMIREHPRFQKTAMIFISAIQVSDIDRLRGYEMGAVDYGPGEPKGTPWHPHRGFETVTYMIDGTFQHQDSHGGGGVITDGATQWMTAGAGILHIETPPEALVMSGGLFHGIQLWVNLPKRDKFRPPRYQSIEGPQVSLLTSHDGGALIRVIAGDIGGYRGPGSTYTPISFLHVTTPPGAQLQLPWRPDFNALVYALAGFGSVGTERRALEGGQLAVFGAGDHLTISAADRQDASSANLEVLVLGGLPIGEPVVHYGPFVMNTEEEIMQAILDYRAGRLGVVPADALMPHVPRD